MEAQVLIPIEAEVFWGKMRNLIEEVMKERDSKGATPKNDAPQLLKVKEVCELFQISKPTIYDWIRKGQLRSIKIESRRFFLIDDIQQLIKKSSAA
jgi:excisionase family DNA binding protein